MASFLSMSEVKPLVNVRTVGVHVRYMTRKYPDVKDIDMVSHPEPLLFKTHFYTFGVPEVILTWLYSSRTTPQKHYFLLNYVLIEILKPEHV